LAFARIELIGPPPLPAALGLMALSVPLAWLSWRFVERPFRTSPARGGFSRPAIFAMSGAAIGGMTALGVAIALSPQTVERIYVAALDAEGRARLEAIETAISSRTEEAAGRSECHIAVQYVDRAALDARLAPCVERYGKATLLLGDSHMGDLFGALAQAPEAPPFLLRIGRGGCVAHRRLWSQPTHPCAYDQVRDLVAARPELFSSVIYVESFALVTPDPFAPDPEDLRLELLDEALDWLAALPTPAPRVVIGPKETPLVDTRLLDPARDLAEQIAARAVDTAPVVARIGDAWRAGAEARGFLYLDLQATLGAAYPRDAILDGALAFHDADHWSLAALRRYGPPIAAALARTGAPGFL
ncbi:MAG: SGNH hydrolase domain-containing protein, partial [Pseudomonadota bacterium]|nr:SGNH hydrolase domain-containing protein [Pseudomonadota bacterium]